MMGISKAALISSLLLLGQASAALPPIVMKGTKFFYENGTQFYIKGVAYQQDSAAAGSSTDSTKFIDPLASASNCKRDVPLLKALGTNAIRTYAIDPKEDHSECMALLDAAGIYVISDLSEPSLSINRDEPLWNVELYERYTAVIDEMSRYPNVIGFFAGNEVTNNKTNTPASAYVKAAVRDTKAYIAANVDRWMGVGYAANDDADIRAEIAHYFNCGNETDAIDFWGYNIYEWCGKSSFKKSGYSEQVDFFKDYSVPVFFAEYGCNLPNGAEARIWDETTALYSDDMTDVISGGIVYMYFQEDNDYGLVEVSGSSASPMKDYDTLKTKMADIKPSSTSMDAYTPTNTAAACPSVNSGWEVVGDSLPPTPDATLCECMVKSLTCMPAAGLNETEYGDIFGSICGLDAEACAGINRDTKTGVYGQFSMCKAQQQLGYVLDAYYKSQNEAADACDWKGQAVVTKASSADATCSDSLAKASSAAASSGGSAAAASSSSFASPVLMYRSLFSIGDLAVGVYAAVAMVVGAMVLVL
ncbi:Glucanosyltransferase-domain-containing protein [Apodospora peruviana]|uniref:1,3-beta-glucanosyltransferase n=1 Tax=Apodospora peruviana TaxID=516989 RepID=A0AAE0IJ92_9PEZI|nr:Glucanosyltransferase-domain-containing protein [Apodospora peruviana]